MTTKTLKQLISEVKKCTLCTDSLPLGARPILQLNQQAKVLIAGQAPGIRVHQSGIPFDDPSGARLRSWMGLSEDSFYDAQQIAILPMGFCYPGTGKSGDLAPRPECAEQWRTELLNAMPNIALTLVIGMYAKKWHLPALRKQNLTQTVKNWDSYWPEILVLPHPSPRNNIWLKKNPWFEKTIIPKLQQRVANLIC